MRVSLFERRVRERRPSRGPSAAGTDDEGFECLALHVKRLTLRVKRGHGLSVSPDAFLLLSLHEFRLELVAAVIGLHHAGDPIEDNADLSSAYEDLGNERGDFKVDHFSVSR